MRRNLGRSRSGWRSRRRNRNAGETAYRRACAKCCRIPEHSAALDEVVAVALEGIWLLGHAPLVDDCTGGFESIELEQAIGGREEFRRSELLFHGLVGDGDRPAVDEARIEECLLGDREKVIPIKRASETLPVEYWIGPDIIGKAAVAIMSEK